MCKVIAFANQKGGVAKTTSTHNIAVALANKGKKVLMIDLDSQASLTISAGLEPTDYELNIVSVLHKDNIDMEKVILPVSENLSLIPSIIDLAALEMDMLSRTSREKILDRAVKKIKNNYDFILIDCPPQLSILTLNALSASDFVIVPVKTDYLSYRGITQLEDTIKDVQELINPNLKFLGVIATLHEKVINDDKEILAALEKNYHVLGVVKKMVAARKGVYSGLAVVDLDPNSDVAKAYVAIADNILKEV